MRWKNKGLQPVEIHAKLAQAREKKEVEAPDLTVVRKFLKGQTHKRGAVETRGRHRLYTAANVRTMNSKRKDRGTLFVRIAVPGL